MKQNSIGCWVIHNLKWECFRHRYTRRARLQFNWQFSFPYRQSLTSSPLFDPHRGLPCSPLRFSTYALVWAVESQSQVSFDKYYHLFNQFRLTGNSKKPTFLFYCSWNNPIVLLFCFVQVFHSCPVSILYLFLFYQWLFLLLLSFFAPFVTSSSVRLFLSRF